MSIFDFDSIYHIKIGFLSVSATFNEIFKYLVLYGRCFPSSNKNSLPVRLVCARNKMGRPLLKAHVSEKQCPRSDSVFTFLADRIYRSRSRLFHHKLTFSISVFSCVKFMLTFSIFFSSFVKFLFFSL
jgi:hypothetical protein